MLNLMLSLFRISDSFVTKIHHFAGKKKSTNMDKEIFGNFSNKITTL
jgi:hypothetical protein